MNRKTFICLIDDANDSSTVLRDWGMPPFQYLRYLLRIESGDTITFLLLAIGAEIRACEEGMRSEAEARARIRLILDLSRSLQATNGVVVDF
jgi:hypothetical protein